MSVPVIHDVRATARVTATVNYRTPLDAPMATHADMERMSSPLVGIPATWTSERTRNLRHMSMDDVLTSEQYNMWVIANTCDNPTTDDTATTGTHRRRGVDTGTVDVADIYIQNVERYARDVMNVPQSMRANALRNVPKKYRDDVATVVG